MVTPQHFHRPLSKTDLDLTPVEAWDLAAKLCYLAVTGNTESKSRVVSLMALHCPNADTKTLLRLAKLGNRYSCSELSRWVAFALVAERDLKTRKT